MANLNPTPKRSKTVTYNYYDFYEVVYADIEGHNGEPTGVRIDKSYKFYDDGNIKTKLDVLVQKYGINVTYLQNHLNSSNNSNYFCDSLYSGWCIDHYESTEDPNPYIQREQLTLAQVDKEFAAQAVIDQQNRMQQAQSQKAMNKFMNLLNAKGLGGRKVINIEELVEKGIIDPLDDDDDE